MKTYRFSEWREMEVINVCNGKRLGCPTDLLLEVGCDCPKVAALCVSTDRGLLGFGGETAEIPWGRVECVGEDSILVRITEEECSCFSCKGLKRR